MKNRINSGRILGYLVGMIVLAIGLTLNTKTQLGVAPVMSMPYCLSVIMGTDYGNTTLVVYVILVVLELIIHVYMKRRRDIPIDMFQIAFSLVFTRFLNIFKDICPDFLYDLQGIFWGSLSGRFLFLGLGIIATGIGAAMMLEARIIPNPADGFVQAIADLTGKETGFVKNCVDAACVTITCAMSMFLAGEIVGIGIGTVLSLLGVGRVIWFYNSFISMHKQQKVRISAGS